MRAALAVAALAGQEKLCGLAMNDLAPEMHKAMGLRPCLPEPDLAGSGFVVAMEADVPATLTMRALALLTGSPPFYTEVFTLDLATNCMLMGHAGWHSLACRDSAEAIQLIPDEEYRAVDRFPGAAIYFPYPAGPVTAVNAVYRPGGLCWSVVEGESLGGIHLEGNCHLLCRIKEPLQDFIRRSTARGVSQHWAVLSGHVEADVRLLADRMRVRLER
jgi:L-fucose isomerase-like protein